MSNYVEVNKTKLINACHQYIGKRAERIECDIQEAIIAQMNKRWFPAKTREQAIANLKKPTDMFGSAWDYFYERGGYSANIVNNLLQMCYIADTDTVVLDDESAYILKGFF